MLLVFLILGPEPAGAASGTWGTGKWPYSNGIVCDLAGTTIPLVAWQLNAVSGPAFLTAGIAETGGQDSGRPPVSVSSTTPDAALAPGSYGQFSTGQIAAIAYLINTWGSDPSASRVAEVSQLIAEQSGHATGSQCLANDVGGSSTAEADAMWTQAQRLAGPYHQTLRPVQQH